METLAHVWHVQCFVHTALCMLTLRASLPMLVQGNSTGSLATFTPPFLLQTFLTIYNAVGVNVRFQLSVTVVGDGTIGPHKPY